MTHALPHSVSLQAFTSQIKSLTTADTSSYHYGREVKKKEVGRGWTVLLWTATVMHANWMSRENAKCSLCSCSSGSNMNRQPMRWREEGGVLGKMARGKDRRIDKREAMCGERNKQTDGGLRTAVEGVDPGEPGQATSTEGLHPPSLSLSQSLRFSLISSFPFCCCFSRRLCSLSLSLKNSLHLAARSKKNHL